MLKNGSSVSKYRAVCSGILKARQLPLPKFSIVSIAKTPAAGVPQIPAFIFIPAEAPIFSVMSSALACKKNTRKIKSENLRI
ncbi:hypothetical protein R83H12_02663 [Fibrobacteria bacterium R8-3-H12]